MKVAIFKELPKEFIKPEFREGKPDIIRFYRTDSFGSSSSNLSYVKLYEYKEIGDKIIINGKDVESFSYEQMYIQPHTSSIDYLLKEGDKETLELMKYCRMGYLILDDLKNEIGFDYTHEVTLDDEYTPTIRKITRCEKREEDIEELLKN
jgi:hypothetical protein